MPDMQMLPGDYCKMVVTVNLSAVINSSVSGGVC